MCFAFPSLWGLYLACPSVTHMGAAEAPAPAACPSSQGRAGLHWVEGGEPKPDSSPPLPQLTGTDTERPDTCSVVNMASSPSLGGAPSYEQHETQEDMPVCPMLPEVRGGSCTYAQVLLSVIDAGRDLPPQPLFNCVVGPV